MTDLVLQSFEAGKRVMEVAMPELVTAREKFPYGSRVTYQGQPGRIGGFYGDLILIVDDKGKEIARVRGNDPLLQKI